EPLVHDVIAPHDLDLHQVLVPPLIIPKAVDAYVVPVGSALGDIENDYLRVEVAADPRRLRSVLPAWSASAVTAALNGWAARVLGRPDLTFVWDEQAGPSPLMRWAIE